MSTWLITLIVVVVLAAVLVAFTASSRARKRREAGAIGLPPVGALTSDEPISAETAPRGDQDAGADTPRPSAADRPAR